MNIGNDRQGKASAEYTVPRDVVPDLSESAKFFPHGRILRALGDLLHKDGLTEFEMHFRDGLYVVSGTASITAMPRPSLLQTILSLGRASKHKPALAMREAQYSIADLLSYDSEARAQRRQTSQLTDPHMPSELLRAVAGYLDKREGSRLIGITIKERWVTIEYLTADGRAQKEKQDFEYFYDYWVRMYTRRSNRPDLPSTSDPTLFVTWEPSLRRHKLTQSPL